MLFGFKEQFAPHILSGRKRGTVRVERKDNRRAKPGKPLALYTGLRTNTCKLIARPTCLFVTPLMISMRGWSHTGVMHEDFIKWFEADPKLADMKINDAFAYADGFESWDELVDYFKPTYDYPFEGVWTTWNPINQGESK